MVVRLLRIDRLTVRYRYRRALDQVSLEVPEGELFGVLGPNGAGKTTLFSVLSGQMRPAGGRATVGGFDVVKRARKVQGMLGIVPQRFAGYEALTAMENLHFFASMYGMRSHVITKRARTLLGMVSLQGRANDPVRTFSGGMRHRLNIILGLIHDPRIVIMDEPTTGLDPLAREELWTIIRDLRERGKTILLTTHYMQEAETLCDRVAILDQGKVRLVGGPAELGGDLDRVFHDCVTADDLGVGATMRREPGGAGPQRAVVVGRTKRGPGESGRRAAAPEDDADDAEDDA